MGDDAPDDAVSSSLGLDVRGLGVLECVPHGAVDRALRVHGALVEDEPGACGDLLERLLVEELMRVKAAPKLDLNTAHQLLEVHDGQRRE